MPHPLVMKSGLLGNGSGWQASHEPVQQFLPLSTLQLEWKFSKGPFVAASTATQLPSPDRPELLSSTTGTNSISLHALKLTSSVAILRPYPKKLPYYTAHTHYMAKSAQDAQHFEHFAQSTSVHNTIMSIPWARRTMLLRACDESCGR